MQRVITGLILKIKEKFSRIKAFFSFCQRSQHSVCDDYSSHFDIRFERLDESALKIVNDRIRLSALLEHKVQVTESQMQIPDEYIGLLTVMNGEIQVYQEYLMIQSIFVEKKILASRRIHLSNLPSLVIGCDNKFHP